LRLSVFLPLLVAFELRSLYGEPLHVAEGVLKLLLLLSVVHHHERVDCLFPPLHGAIVPLRAVFAPRISPG
jgi:hypothetical protein